MKTEIDELIEKAQKEEKYFKNYLAYGKIIKEEAKKLLQSHHKGRRNSSLQTQ